MKRSNREFAWTWIGPGYIVVMMSNKASWTSVWTWSRLLSNEFCARAQGVVQVRSNGGVFTKCNLHR